MSKQIKRVTFAPNNYGLRWLDVNMHSWEIVSACGAVVTWWAAHVAWLTVAIRLNIALGQPTRPSMRLLSVWGNLWLMMLIAQTTMLI
ncbi:hypothetical protein ACPESL_01300 [Psychrobacter pocilloporae]|uniref:hypothetical protein n=1 Tax=Psychrobacter pocilloporae TaxID=1775882 RepID=UPI003C2B0777